MGRSCQILWKIWSKFLYLPWSLTLVYGGVRACPAACQPSSLTKSRVGDVAVECPKFIRKAAPWSTKCNAEIRKCPGAYVCSLEEVRSCHILPISPSRSSCLIKVFLVFVFVGKQQNTKALKQNISFSISCYLYFILWQIQFSFGFPDGVGNIRVINADNAFLFYLSI